MVDTEQVRDDIAATYAHARTEFPDHTSEQLAEVIRARMNPADLRAVIEEELSGDRASDDEVPDPVLDFVWAMEFDEDDDEDED